MPAKSNHYGDVYNWISKIIDSCESDTQKESTLKLINLFEDKYDGDLSHKLRLKLMGDSNALLLPNTGRKKTIQTRRRRN